MSLPIEDTIMKNIMELFKGDAVKFFGINKQVIAPARTEFSQIPIQRKTGDWLWETDDDSYLHFEFQSDYDKQDMSRFMLTDAMVFFKTGKRVKTVVVYSADITETITTLDAGAIKYNVDAFYMSSIDGDKTYADIKAKVANGEHLTKHDLLAIVFLPMMKNSVNKATRFEHAINLSKEISAENERLQIQEMLKLLAEKFIIDVDVLKKLKEMVNVGIINQMIRDDAAKEEKYEIAKRLLKRGLSIPVVAEDTGLEESIVINLQAELTAA